MASVYEKNGKWYLRVKDAGGHWKDRVSKAKTKTEARRLAEDLERKAERQRHGLEPLMPENGGGTLRELLRWWLDTYSRGTPSHERNEYTVERHLLDASIARLRLQALTTSDVENFLHAKSESLAPQTLSENTDSYGGWSSAAASRPRHRVIRVQARSV